MINNTTMRIAPGVLEIQKARQEEIKKLQLKELGMSGGFYSHAHASESCVPILTRAQQACHQKSGFFNQEAALTHCISDARLSGQLPTVRTLVNNYCNLKDTMRPTRAKYPGLNISPAAKRVFPHAGLLLIIGGVILTAGVGVIATQ